MLCIVTNILVTWYEELTPLKRPWCWERLRAGGERDDRGWDGWMASLTWWTWIWVNSGRWWWKGRPGVLWFIGLQRVGHDWVTELNWTDQRILRYQVLSPFSLLPRNFGSLEKTLRRIVRRFSDHSWGNLVREWTQLCLAWQKKSWICSNLQFWDHRG